MSWSVLRTEDPELAAAGERLLSHTGPCAALLGTVRRDGGPRLHPVYPILNDDGLWVFIVEMGWKYRDLVRDGRFALHCFPTPAGGEEFYADGRAEKVDEQGIRAKVAGGRHLLDFERLFRLDIERALWTTWTGWGTAATWPVYRKWNASQGP